jgi:hypothetical protein
MNEDNGINFVSLIDEAGNTVDLEIIETFDYKDRTFTAFLPMDVPKDSPDYGLVFLENLYEDDEVVFDTINDMDEMEVYEAYQQLIFAQEDEDE